MTPQQQQRKFFRFHLPDRIATLQKRDSTGRTERDRVKYAVDHLRPGTPLIGQRVVAPTQRRGREFLRIRCHVEAGLREVSLGVEIEIECRES